MSQARTMPAMPRAAADYWPGPNGAGATHVPLHDMADGLRDPRAGKAVRS